MGLSTRHAYSVLGVLEHNGSRLIRLHNPWGHGGWKGRFSREWKGWGKEERNLVYPKPATKDLSSTVKGTIMMGSNTRTQRKGASSGAAAGRQRNVIEVTGEGEGDGTFIMCIEDFCKYFGSIDMALVRDGWWQARRVGHLPFDPCAAYWPAYRIQCPTSEGRLEMELAISQPSERLMKWWSTQVEESSSLLADSL